MFCFPYRIKVPIWRQNNSTNRRHHIFPVSHDTQLRLIRQFVDQGRHLVRQLGGRQSRDDHGYRALHGSWHSGMGQHEPPHLERGGVRHLPGHHGQRSHFRDQRQDQDRELRDREHGPSKNGGLGKSSVRHLFLVPLPRDSFFAGWLVHCRLLPTWPEKKHTFYLWCNIHLSLAEYGFVHKLRRIFLWGPVEQRSSYLLLCFVDSELSTEFFVYWLTRFAKNISIKIFFQHK